MPRPLTANVIYRIETPRLILRCWEPADAPALLDAISSSLEHLKRWLPWAVREVEPLNVKANRIREWRSKFDRGEDFFFAIVDRDDEHRVLGGIGFHSRIGAGAREIGYWIRAESAGKGFMTEAAGALMRIGFEHDGLARIEIHCDPANLASAAIPRKLGFRPALTIANHVPGPKNGPRDTAIFMMTRSEFASSPAAKIELRAFDALKSQVELVTN